MVIRDPAMETVSVERSRVGFIRMICVLRRKVRKGSACADATAMQIVVTAVGPNPPSRGFSLAGRRTRAQTRPARSQTRLNNHILQANSGLAETIINGDLCDPVSVKRKFTPPDTS